VWIWLPAALAVLQPESLTPPQLQPAEAPTVLAAASSRSSFAAPATAALPADALGEAELATAASVGDTVLPVVSTLSFMVGGVVRLHAGYPNQEDHRVRSVSHNAVYLATAGLEFPHNRYELVSMLAVEPLCPSNCSSRGTCEDGGTCACAEGFAGHDCSSATAVCGANGCNSHGVCVQGLCHCNPGFAGGHCQVVAQLCAGNCSGHGICSHDLGGAPICSCEPGFIGADCALAAPSCPGNCTGHGNCVGNECQCHFGFSGSDCTVVTGGCPGNCTGHGECLGDGSCLCEPSYQGADCALVSAFSLCKSNCSARGACVMGECRCDAGFGGEACDEVLASCPANCSGHGYCNSHVSVSGQMISHGCECEVGFAGADCMLVMGGCPGNCTGHGSCFNGTCFCDSGFTHDDCSLVMQTCDKNCSGHGRCIDGACDCYDGFDGSACDVVLGNVCPRNCTGHGACDEAARVCICDAGYGGGDCSGTTESCPSGCSMHGNCVDGSCQCVGGFAGSDCSVSCPERCHAPNGRCQLDGSCECKSGWRGATCDTPDMAHQFAATLKSTREMQHTAHGLDFVSDVSTKLDGTLWIFYPLAMIASCAVAVLVLFCCISFCCNLREGHRGTQAIPLYRYLSSTMSYSDYQLKPNPNPGM